MSGRPSDPIAEAKRQWEVHGWSDAAPGMAAVTTLFRVHQLLLSQIEQTLAPMGLTFARFEILRLLGFSRAGLPMGVIGERLMIHPASVTSAVKRLERDELIRRAPDANDNRVVLASLRPDGVDLLDRATEAMNRLFEAVETEGLDEAMEWFDRIRAAAGDRFTR